MKDTKNRQKLTIVIGIDNLFSAGAQRLVIDVLKQPAFEQFNVHLVTFIEDTERENLMVELPDYVVYHHISMSGFRNVRSWYSLYKLLRSIRPQVVWTHFFLSNTVFRVLKPLLGYRTVITEHNTYTWKKWHHNLVDRVLAWWTYKIVAVSKEVARFESETQGIPSEKFLVIHNGVDVEGIRKKAFMYTKNETKKVLGLPMDRKYLINVSRLVSQKNQTVLIKAFSIFAKFHSEYDLLIAGEGPLKADLQKQIENADFTERIHLLGHRSDVASLYRASEFFVLTSKIEGFALVCIEAMAAGIPAVATKVAGPDEYIENGKNGYLTTNQPQEIAKHLNQLESDLQNGANYTESTNQTAEHYNIKATAKNYYDLLCGKLD